MRSSVRRALSALVVIAGAFVLAGPVSAHTTVSPSEVPSGGYATVYFQVPHGCDGEPTNVVSVKLRDDISSVKAEMVPGWTVSYAKAPLSEPYSSHGREITEYVDTVTWTSDGAPLPDDQFMRFGLSMKVPDLPGEDMLLPAVQTCPSGAQEAWIDPDPSSGAPAPMLTLVASGGDGHGGGSSASVDMAEAEVATAVTAASSDSSTSPAALIVAIVALVLAAVAAVVAFTNRRAAS